MQGMGDLEVLPETEAPVNRLWRWSTVSVRVQNPPRARAVESDRQT